MTRNEFIKLLKENLKPNAQMDFLLIDCDKIDSETVEFLDIVSVNMNADIDDPNNKKCGGIVFKPKKENR